MQNPSYSRTISCHQLPKASQVSMTQALAAQTCAFPWLQWLRDSQNLWMWKLEVFKSKCVTPTILQELNLPFKTFEAYHKLGTASGAPSQGPHAPMTQLKESSNVNGHPLDPDGPDTNKKYGKVCPFSSSFEHCFYASRSTHPQSLGHGSRPEGNIWLSKRRWIKRNQHGCHIRGVKV